jgi:hypothetical protein
MGIYAGSAVGVKSSLLYSEERMALRTTASSDT